ncbi:MAG TPA: hypothetical protein VEK86_06985 [Gemmatimonadales bacterium]|nr:hypothetical protein [Gemmatimonadales bacterium]
MGRRFGFAMLAVAMFTGPAAAQRPGTMEAGLFARVTMFDPSLGSPQSALGFGGRIAAYARAQWFVEADLSTSSANGLDYTPFHIRVNYLEEFKPGGLMIAGLGYARNHYSGTLDGNDNGLSGVFGLRQAVRGSFVGRLDFALDYIPSPVNRAGNNWQGSFQVGGSYRFGRP